MHIVFEKTRWSTVEKGRGPAGSHCGSLQGSVSQRGFEGARRGSHSSGHRAYGLCVVLGQDGRALCGLSAAADHQPFRASWLAGLAHAQRQALDSGGVRIRASRRHALGRARSSRPALQRAVPRELPVGAPHSRGGQACDGRRRCCARSARACLSINKLQGSRAGGSF